MATVSQGSSQVVDLGPDDSYRISAAADGEAYVDLQSGAPGSPYASPRLRGPTATKIFGPFGTAVRIRIRAIAGAVTYNRYKRTEAFVEEIDGVASVVDAAGNMVGGPISTACRAFLPLNQPASTGYPRDLSGNAITAYPMGTYTDAAWAANAGYLTVGAGANLGLVIPSTELDLSAADGRNLLFAIGVKKATPAGEEPLLGWSSGAGTGAGINLAVTSAGKLRVYGTTTQLSTANVAASTLTVADGTDHTIALFIRNDINQLEVYVDGWLSNAVSYRNAAGHRDFGQSAFLALGGAGGSEQTTYAAQFRGLHAYTVPDRFTAIQLLVQKLRANILQPLSAGDL